MADIERDGKPTVEKVDNAGHKNLSRSQHGHNVGYEEYREALSLEISNKEMRKVRIKIDMIIVPIFLVTQGLQFLDRTALNYANLFNYQEALNLKGQEFNYLAAMVYAGYFFGQYPCGWLIGRYPAQKWLDINDRILVHAKRDSSPPVHLVLGSYISTGIAKLPENTTPERWQIIFYIKLIAVKRVSGNETGIKTKNFDMKQVWLGFTDVKAILLFIGVFAAAIPNGVVNSFSTIIIKDLGFSTEKTTELKSVGDAVNIVALLIGGTVILNIPNSRLLTATVANLLCTISATTLGFLPRSNTWGRLASFWLVNSQSVGFTVSLTTISSNMAGYTHRSFASALVFTAYCWGNFAGPFVVKQSEAPTYKGATIGLLVGYGIKLVCHLILLAYMYSVNRYRNMTYGPQNKEASDEAGMNDQTEFQNKDFRYVL
ncbi:hypothetical protein CHU98_g7240 [Xylaria longipes]|nr:hypothetical protein CHU98_g7240 [Xylaria longipes]